MTMTIFGGMPRPPRRWWLRQCPRRYLDRMIDWFEEIVLDVYTWLRVVTAPKGTMFWTHTTSEDDWL